MPIDQSTIELIHHFAQSVPLGEQVLFAHADHDGVVPAAVMRHLIGKMETHFSQAFRPKELPPTDGKKLFWNVDLQLEESQIWALLNQGLIVVNLDHHEVRLINHENYTCLNPKFTSNQELSCSSQVVWDVWKPVDCAWLLAAAATVDVAPEGSESLLHEAKKAFPELKLESLPKIYHSKLFEWGQIVFMAFDDPQQGLLVCEKAIEEGPNGLYDSDLFSNYQKKQEKMKLFFENPKDRIVNGKKFTMINTSGEPYAGSYAVYWNVQQADEKMYVEYADGRLSFKQYFGIGSIFPVAALFGGGGASRRTGGGYTRKSFEEAADLVANHFGEGKQKTLF